MPLTTTKDLFAKALKGKYALGAFNVNNMELVQAIVAACEEEKAPLILQISRGARSYANPVYLKKLIEAAVSLSNIPIAVHLDHGDTFELCKECIDEGFTSVMIDGSHLPFEENIAITKKVVEYAPAFSIPQSVREKMFDSSKRLASYVGYRNAGTLEFLDPTNYELFSNGKELCLFSVLLLQRTRRRGIMGVQHIRRFKRNSLRRSI